eukprot:CAMPEP_0183723178 /NCGR_PEP_ID=MMETSP0737-20130205/14855_1 /TAXON_ID=385413 /ORGANISM="Thalassiosira miniscula, Strain CCMP1093" /LENGTH=1301 /DNA_ID=CAMNT_0025953431 /DNA_START=308 /DNA_END=4213 /DNA_ORIENTATION=-
MADDGYSTSSSNSTPRMTLDEYAQQYSSHDTGFDFTSKDDDQSESEQERRDDSDDDQSNSSAAESSSSSNSSNSESGSDDDVDDIPSGRNINVVVPAIVDTRSSDAMKSLPPSSDKGLVPPSSSSSSAIPHRGALRRILNPSSFHVGQNTIPAQSLGQSKQSQATTSSSWPMYAINVATENAPVQYLQVPDWEGNHQQCYQIIFDRQQYEFCTRLFALLDTESQSFIGPECVREFVSLHCPVVRRRDDAIFALRYGGEQQQHHLEKETNERGKETSPTFDEIWERTVRSDPRYAFADDSTPSTYRIGIEGWMVFCRLIALAHHQESQRRFASRHLQQMMRHKHGGGSARMNPNEIVVVVDNPPPGPPSLICIRGLVDVEQERAMSNRDECIQGWPFCPLPMPELDLDHSLASTFGNHRNLSGEANHYLRGTVSVEPFSSSREGDFILRFQSTNGSTMVVRRSYLDFEWLNAILKLHKRPGQGHLCGRILPPFPSRQGTFHRQHRKDASRTRGASHHGIKKDISERAIEAAKSGMGMISSMAKSVWSEYVSGSTPSSSPSSSLSKNKTGLHKVPLSTGDDVTVIVARRIERYLNYLLENDALSTSFTLNAILRASQSGLESAKQTLQDHTKNKKRQRSNLVTATSRAGSHSAASIFSALTSKTSTSLLCLQDDDDTPWLRSAAQVAMALQFHGILETTGHESTSAKIQHASLPKFCNRPGSWDDEEAGNGKGTGNAQKSHHSGPSEFDSPGAEANFEAGVINVESELADEEDLGGYDMLPSPGPSEEHCVLNAGNDGRGKLGSVRSRSSKSRFVYGTTSEQPDEVYDRKDSVLGSIRVENDIDKLREIIRSINHTLGKLYHSSKVIQSAQDERNAILLSVLRDIDSWGDSGGEVISQRALVDGVAALEAYSNVIDESNNAMTSDILWQSSLAFSAVAAASEVRDAVKASKTASRAKSAAFAAAEKAKKAYESCDHSSSKEKIQHTQTEASTARSHAIHATVVEYEANIAKKRSAISLAQDVKSWNVHRKRELLQTCVQVAKSQQEACRKAADAWESLRDGLINSSGFSYTENEVGMWVNPLHISQGYSAPPTAAPRVDTQEILASEFSTSLEVSDEIDPANHLSIKGSDNSSGLHDWENSQQDFSDCAAETPATASSVIEDFAECVDEAANSVSSVVDGFADICSSKDSQQSQSQSQSEMEDESPGNVYCLSPPDLSQLDEDYFSLHQGIIAEVNSESDENEDGLAPSIHESFHSQGQPNGDAMSTSMQSLIDGLMAWGDEDVQSNDDGAVEQNAQHNRLFE